MMMKFCTTVLVLALIATGDLGVSASSSLRSLSTDQQQHGRHLSYELIAYYEPKSQVTDHNAIDLDQEAMENSLYKNTDQSFQIARDIYTNGAHSKSVAEITLTTPLTKAIKKGASVTGKNSDGALVVGKVYDDYATGSSAIGVQYKVINIQKNYMNCQVGGLQSPNLQGCLAASGLLNVDGIDGDLSYSYDPTTKNVNKRTIQGFSTSAEEKMYRCENCPYNTYRKFREYYGFFDYADKWINAAFDGTSTAFSNGNGNFASYGFAGKTEAIKKATAYMSIWMYVIREMEDALDDCNEGCKVEGCNDDPVHAWDEAVAFYTGSLEGGDGAGDGKLLYALADKRCKDFRTCGDMAKESKGTAHTNGIIMQSFNIGSNLLIQGKCAQAKPYKEIIERMMVVPLIQGTLRYAYILCAQLGKALTGKDLEKAEAEGAVFAASVLPLVHACDEDAATTIYNMMRTGQSGPHDYSVVKSAFESVYECMGVRNADVGGLWSDETGSYLAGAAPLKVASSSGEPNIGLIVGCVVAGIVGGIILYFIVSKLCKLCCGSSSPKEAASAGDISKPDKNEEGALPAAEIINSDGEAVQIS